MLWTTYGAVPTLDTPRGLLFRAVPWAVVGLGEVWPRYGDRVERVVPDALAALGGVGEQERRTA